MPRPPYPSDLTETEWPILRSLIPPPQPGGHPRTVDMREILNGVLDVSRTGCSWRSLPHDLPPGSTIYDSVRQYRTAGTWERLNAALREQVRLQEGRAATPSAALLDTQSVKTTDKGGCAVTMPANTSKDANAICEWTPWGFCSWGWFTPPRCRTRPAPGCF